MEEHLSNLEDKVSTFISTYTAEKQELRTKVEKLESILGSQVSSPISSHSVGHVGTLSSTPVSQSQIHTSISVTHLKAPNNYNRCSTTLTNGCKTTQLSLSVENLEYDHSDHLHEGVSPQRNASPIYRSKPQSQAAPSLPHGKVSSSTIDQSTSATED